MGVDADRIDVWNGVRAADTGIGTLQVTAVTPGGPSMDQGRDVWVPDRASVRRRYRRRRGPCDYFSGPRPIPWRFRRWVFRQPSSIILRAVCWPPPRRCPGRSRREDFSLASVMIREVCSKSMPKGFSSTRAFRPEYSHRDVVVSFGRREI